MPIRPRLNGYRCAIAVALCCLSLAPTPVISPVFCHAQDQPQSDLRAYGIRHRKADDIAPQLRNMLSGLAGRSTVTVDQEGNRLLVQGQAASQQLAQQVLKALDKPENPSPSPAAATAADAQAVVKSYRVNGDLERAAADLRSRFPAQQWCTDCNGSADPTVVGDRST